MFHLFLAILCSASIALIFKYTENEKMNRYVITSSNYFIAFMISLIMILSKGLLTDVIGNGSFFDEFKLLGSGYIFSAYGSIIWGLIVGGIFGGFFFMSFVYYQKSIKENGVGISGTISKLGILIPMIFSIILWNEIPSVIQWIGIALALISIVIVNLSDKSKDSFDIKAGLILLFVFGGLAEFSNKIYQKYALSSYKDIFLFMIFFTAFLISTYFTRRKNEKISLKDILTGFMVGIPNLFSSYFLILSLDTLTTSVAFPLYSAGSIVLINIGGALIFKEKINRKGKIAILLTVLALILINI